MSAVWPVTFRNTPVYVSEKSRAANRTGPNERNVHERGGMEGNENITGAKSALSINNFEKEKTGMP